MFWEWSVYGVGAEYQDAWMEDRGSQGQRWYERKYHWLTGLQGFEVVHTCGAYEWRTVDLKLYESDVEERRDRGRPWMKWKERGINTYYSKSLKPRDVKGMNRGRAEWRHLVNGKNADVSGLCMTVNVFHAKQCKSRPRRTRKRRHRESWWSWVVYGLYSTTMCWW